MAKRNIRIVFDGGTAVALVRGARSEEHAIAIYLGDRFEAPIADQDHLLTNAGLPIVDAPQPKSAP